MVSNGAGIVGLTTAAHLQDQLPQVKVTVIADKFNTETTSDGAAGLFLPSSDFKGPTPASAKNWMAYSYKYYKELIDKDCGIFETYGYLLSSDKEEDVQNHLMVGVAPEYRPATQEELQQFPGGWKYGTFMKSLVIRGRYHLPWLLERIKSKGGVIIKKKVETLEELSEEYDVVVNCSGLGSKQLANDEEVFPIRGQIVQVKAPSVNHFLMVNGFGTYIIPNENNLVTLGGFWQHHDWESKVRPHESVDIKARCTSVLPSLSSVPVTWEWTGLRPYRPTVRVEAEKQNGLKIVHNYGHGGYGVTTAPGTAFDAVNLVSELLKN